MAAPLYALTKSKTEFTWTHDAERAFTQLKGLLTSPPVLSYPLFDRPFVLHTSGQGLGAVLEQEQDDKTFHLVAYASRTLSKANANYRITDLEALSLVWALKHFRVCLTSLCCIH